MDQKLLKVIHGLNAKITKGFNKEYGGKSFSEGRVLLQSKLASMCLLYRARLRAHVIIFF